LGELQSALDALVRNGRALEKLPAVAAGCSEGVITAEQVAVVAEVATPENVERAAEQGVDLGEVDAVLAEAAATGQHAQLRRVVAHYLARLDPDGIEPDPTEGRSLSLARHGDGSITGRFELDPVGGRSCRPRSNRSCRPPGPRATCGPAPPLGDGLVQLADNALASGQLPVLRTVKPQLIVTIPLADLVDPATGPAAASTGFGAILSAARTRWAACDGSSSSATGTACSPAAKPPATGATSTICSSGCSTTARPHPRTARSCANGTTPRSTTASGSSDHPTADGAPTAPTAPRSSSLHRRRRGSPRPSSGGRARKGANAEWGGTPATPARRGTISRVTSAATQHLRDLARLRRVRDRIDREYAQPLDVEALARGVHMSAGHLSREFRQAYGESPYAYLMTRRIERAMALLRRGDLSVTEVCFAVGCSSLGTFSTRFTELVGVPPSVYRREATRATAGMPACVAKQVTRPVRNREAPVAEPHLA